MKLCFTNVSLLLCFSDSLLHTNIFANGEDASLNISEANNKLGLKIYNNAKVYSIDTTTDENNTENTCDEGDASVVEYTAAVLEYDAYSDLSEGGLALLQENARIFLEYAGQALQQGADIIVFPEYGLTSTCMGSTIDVFLSQTQIVPAVENDAIPCYFNDVNNYTKVMQDLSCGAIELGMYLVVNMAEQVECSNATVSGDSFSDDYYLAETGEEEDNPIGEERAKDCPDSGYFFYNTLVVFDHLGKVIAKYRKKHLFLEPYFTPGDQPDVEATFNTNFGVSFTMQICFDIMYESPAVHNIEALGVHDVIISTGWIDELPFLTAPQMWKGWSEGNRVNLLAANYHAPSKGKLGSGIFPGFKSGQEMYSYSAKGGTTLIVRKVSTNSTVNSTAVPESGRIKSLGQQQMTAISHASQSQKEEIIDFEESGNEIPDRGEVIYSGKTQGMNIAENQTFYHEDLSNYNHSVLERTSSDLLLIKNLCHEDGLCCTLAYTYRLNETEEGLFMLLAYSGIVEKGGGVYDMYTQTCAVVFCLNENITSCALIEGEDAKDSTLRVYELSGTFADRHIYPSVFTQNLELHDPADWIFSIIEYPDYIFGEVNIHEKVDNILSITLFSRWYSMDP